MSTIALPAPASAPAWALLGIEPIRAALEYAGMRWMNKTVLPHGDGHPVVIFPGLAADERSIGPLKDFCEQLGYAAYDWGRGLNTGPQGDVDAWLDELAQHVHGLVGSPGEPVSLVGWSLGGIYAREVAKKLPGRVRQVITIGTPFAGSAEQTNMSWVYRLVNAQEPMLDESLMTRLRTPPNVPTTSIFSRSDGVVAWQAASRMGFRNTRRTLKSKAVIAAWAGTRRCFLSSRTDWGNRQRRGNRTPARPLRSNPNDHQIAA